jgi:endonuclease YncB( thermonuclease family)
MLLQTEKDNFQKYDYKTPLFSLASSEKKPARVVGVHDGDTLSCILMVGDRYSRFVVRLQGVDTPEITSHDPVIKERATIARNFVIERVTGFPLPLDPKKKNEKEKEKWTRTDICKYLCEKVYMVNLVCSEMDKYGRLLAEVFVNDSNSQSINAELIAKGYANAYDGGHKQEFSS